MVYVPLILKTFAKKWDDWQTLWNQTGWIGSDSNGCVWVGNEEEGICTQIGCLPQGNLLSPMNSPVEAVAESGLVWGLKALEQWEGNPPQAQWVRYLLAALIAMALLTALTNNEAKLPSATLAMIPV